MKLPESELISGEITLRDMQLSQEVKLTKKSLLRWLALSMGLISPNESRTLMLDVLEALFYFQLGEKRDPSVPDVMGYLKSGLGKGEQGEKAVRYHLLQLQNLGLVERRKGRYCFSVSPLSEKGDFSATIDFVYKRRSDMAIAKIKEAYRELSYSFSKRRQPQVELVQFIKKSQSGQQPAAGQG
ncbi:MAG: hypothetical protein PHF51_04465 [Candidatus ainarchaeum sp.]|nr:hypothetical protein [Candidatus ainarchaeum sp.]